MEETHTSPKLEEIDLINNLERISSNFPNIIVTLKGLFFKENHKQLVEILIFKDFSSST